MLTFIILIVLGDNKVLTLIGYLGTSLQYSCLENTMDGGAW